VVLGRFIIKAQQFRTIANQGSGTSELRRNLPQPRLNNLDEESSRQLYALHDVPRRMVVVV
jgi:hypothetical protein